MSSSKTRPKIMLVYGLATQKVGGMEKFMWHFLREMDARGWDTVFCFDGTIAENIRGYLNHPAATLELVDGQKNLGLSAASTLWGLLRKHKPQVFAYGFHGVMRVFPWMARLAGVRGIFFNDHSSRPLRVTVKRMSLLKRLIGKSLTWPLTGIISVSEYVRRSAAITDLSTAPNIVISNGVEVGEPDPARGVRFRQQHGIPLDATVFTMSVWMIEAKGVNVLLRASVDSIRSNPSVWLLLIGDGPRLNEYRQLAQDLGTAGQVVFPGLLSDPVGLGVFDATDVFCQPSLWQEASGLAVLEAMSMKLPVIASDIGGLPEIVKENETGLLFPPGDVLALQAKLLVLAADEEMRRRMGEAGRASVLQHHQVQQVAFEYANLLTGHRDATRSRT